jgi:hypothetical protein
MTAGVNILNLTNDTNLASVTLECLNPSDWTVESYKSEEKSGAPSLIETTYKFTAGSDAEHVARLRVGWYASPAALLGTGQVNVSVKFSTWTKHEDDAGEITYHPFTMTFASSCAGKSGVPNTAEYLLCLQNVLSVFTRAVDTGALTGAPVDKIRFGVTHILV